MNAMDIEKLQTKANQMGLYDAEGNLTITDAQMVTLMRSQNLPISEELKKAAMQRKNGVTKVVKKKGYTYVYLSATTGKVICIGSIGAAMFLTAITGGLGFQLALAVVNTVSGISWSYLNNGIWLKFKGLKLVGKGRQ